MELLFGLPIYYCYSYLPLIRRAKVCCIRRRSCRWDRNAERGSGRDGAYAKVFGCVSPRIRMAFGSTSKCSAVWHSILARLC
ncbi:hypothetical protein TRIATDRAFT_302090 [Trichoderma atroviride IMI 206040]|uniref:Uncharacterized protein n=1 Tax=Hypocrea atroviridis (strain ATCC 20476 / IMI 206040) TaxID=452589 RepID=G9P7N1_HYPAI|nr:uncharacterized protein TRIATDRAFT_302090 [Trichoderma atroviride IMI 206040]EHK41622.1 hypothetical protein TRIATDRAFT_302090 [Trichoderma atroviride IMI 206040]